MVYSGDSISYLSSTAEAGVFYRESFLKNEEGRLDSIIFQPTSEL